MTHKKAKFDVFLEIEAIFFLNWLKRFRGGPPLLTNPYFTQEYRFESPGLILEFQTYPS